MPNRFLSIDEITAEAMSVIQDATSEERVWAKQWAYTALRQIGPTRDNIEVCTLYPEDMILRKPDDLQSTIDISVFNSNNCELKSKYRGGKLRIHEPTNVYLQNGQYLAQFGSSVEISEDNNFFYLSNNADSVTYAKLRYFKLPVDIEGNPMFPEYTRLAIILFIKYMWSLRCNDPMVDFHRISWVQEKASAKSKGKLTALELKQVAKEFNSMIGKVNFDRF